MKKIVAIIVNYNTKNILRECLDNLKNNYENMEVIVVDNASTDGSADMVEKEFSWAKLIKAPNKGLAYATNLALKNTSADYYLHLGTDAFPNKEGLKKMISYMETQPEVGVVTPKLITRSGKLDMDAHRGFPTPWVALTNFSKLNKIFPKSKIFNRYFIGWANMDVPHEIDLCISHFMLVKSDVYKDVKKWDADFFVYGEDVDFCYRVKEAGWKIIYMGNVEALHYKGVGVGRKESKDIKTASNSSKKTRVSMRRASAQAMKLFYKKHFDKKYPKVLTLPIYLMISVLEFVRTKRS
jgi:hypothetical protein